MVTQVVTHLPSHDGRPAQHDLPLAYADGGEDPTHCLIPLSTGITHGPSSNMEHHHTWSPCVMMVHVMDHHHTWTIITHGPSSHMDHHHTWTIIKHGPSSHMDHHHTWTIITHGASSHMDHHHTWTIITHGASSHMDHHHTWTIITHGPSSNMDHHHTWTIIKHGPLSDMDHHQTRTIIIKNISLPARQSTKAIQQIHGCEPLQERFYTFPHITYYYPV